MADGRDDRFNMPAQRGAKLRYQGDQLGNKPEYSDDLDYSQAGPLNARTRMREDQQSPPTASSKLRGETGLIIKEPLS